VNELADTTGVEPELPALLELPGLLELPAAAGLLELWAAVELPLLPQAARTSAALPTAAVSAAFLETDCNGKTTSLLAGGVRT